MNLIVNRQLDRAQKQVIYELTLKKCQSKKSTMSERQLAARQQLARELMQERRVAPVGAVVRLEHLFEELERRLHQYEYLVAREKALLGAYNVMLFTNEGVNNFHLYDALSTPSRRLRTLQHQQQQQQQQQHKPSLASPRRSASSVALVTINQGQAIESCY